MSSSNFNAYNSIELLSSFPDKASLDAYRNMRIQRYQEHVDFLLSYSNNEPISVIEIGSGSSALLYAIAQRGLLHNAKGIELSQSRWMFAEHWKRDNKCDFVENINDNFINVKMGKSDFDWFLIIDNTFTYLAPESENYPVALLTQAYESLKPNGRIVIDFINYACREENVDYRQWASFLKGDPYSYGLYSNKITNGIN